MPTANMERGVLIARDAHSAVMDLKKLVDRVAEEVREAELETTGLAIRGWNSGDPLTTLRAAAETLRSPEFESALLEARAKTETAFAWHKGAQGSWKAHP